MSAVSGRLAAAGFLAAVSIRLVIDIVRVLRKTLPATRLIFPAVVAVELALVVGGRASRRTLAPVALAIELPLLVWGVAILIRRKGDHNISPERRIEDALAAFVPGPVARALSLEFLAIGLGIRALFPPYRRELPPGFGYSREAYLRFVPVLFIFTVPADVMLLGVLLPPRLWLVHRVVTALDIYGFFWVLGLLETMRRRPHRVGPGRVDLFRGALNHFSFAPADLAGVTIPPRFDTREELKRYAGDALLMTLSGSGIVELALNKPVAGDGLIAPWRRPVTRVLVAADDPGALSGALREVRPEGQPEK
jgi:hypothetical protein